MRKNETKRIFFCNFFFDSCKKDIKPRTFILFSDILLYASDGVGGLRLSKVFQLSDGLVVSENCGGRTNAFEIRTPQKTFVVIAKDGHSRADWMRTLTAVVDRAARKAAEAAALSASQREAAEAALRQHAGEEGDEAASSGDAKSAERRTSTALDLSSVGESQSRPTSPPLTPRGGEAAPLWMSDNASSECVLCQRRFGLVVRRHHVRLSFHPDRAVAS